MICTNCGNNVQDNSQFCNFCGQNFQNHQNNNLKIMNYSNVENSLYRNCPNCNKEISSGSSVCKWCGYNFNSINNGLRQYDIQYQQQGIMKQYGNLYYIAVIIGIVASAMCIISIFLPFYTASAFGVSKGYSLESTADGKVILGLALFALAVSIPKKNQSQGGIAHLLFGVALIGMAILETNETESGEQYEYYGAFLNRDNGYYFLVIGGILIIIAGIVFSVNKKRNTK